MRDAVLKTFDEVMQEALSGLSEKLPKGGSGWQVLCDKREGWQGIRHPITIAQAGRKEEGYVVPVFDAEDVYDYYKETRDLDAALNYFADLYNKAVSPKTQSALQDLALLLCRDPLLLRRNLVGWFVRNEKDKTAGRLHRDFGSLSLIYFISLERFGVQGAVPITDATMSRIPFLPDEKALPRIAADNREDIDPMIIRDLSKEYQDVASGIRVFQVTTLFGERGSGAILYRGAQDFLKRELGEHYYVLPVSSSACLALTVPVPVSFSSIRQKLVETEIREGHIPAEKRLTDDAFSMESGFPVPL